MMLLWGGSRHFASVASVPETAAKIGSTQRCHCPPKHGAFVAYKKAI